MLCKVFALVLAARAGDDVGGGDVRARAKAQASEIAVLTDAVKQRRIIPKSTLGIVFVFIAVNFHACAAMFFLLTSDTDKLTGRHTPCLTPIKTCILPN